MTPSVLKNGVIKHKLLFDFNLSGGSMYEAMQMALGKEDKILHYGNE